LRSEGRGQKAEVRHRRARFVVSLLPSAFCLLTFSSCATAPASLPVPQWNAVPAGIVESLCRRLQDDAIATVGTLAIVRTTQPLANTTTMSSLASAYYKKANTAGAVDAMVASHGSIPIDVAGGSCTWDSIGGIDAAHRDMMVVELSSPLANPYARNEAGLFARVSLGGSEPSWYWIPLGQRGGAWSIGHIMPLGAR
jgi:hypothetical protein